MSNTEVHQEVRFPIMHVACDRRFEVNVSKLLTPDEARRVAATLRGRHDFADNERLTCLHQKAADLFIHATYLPGMLRGEKLENFVDKCRKAISSEIAHKIEMREQEEVLTT